MKDITPSSQHQGFLKRQMRHWRLVVCLSLLGVLILLVMPTLVKYGLQHWLQEQGHIEATIADIDLNPFSGQITLHSLQIKSATGEDYNLATISLNLSWLSLLKGRIHIQEATLTDGSIDLSLPDQDMGSLADRPGPFDFSNLPGGPIWPLGVDKLRLEKMRIHYILESGQEVVLINQLTLTDFLPWQEQEQSSATIFLRAQKAAGSLKFTGTCSWDNQQLQVGGNLDITNFPLAAFGPLLPPGINEPHGTMTCRQQLSLTVPLPLDRKKMALATTGSLKGQDLFAAGYGHTFSGRLDATIDADVRLSMVDQALLADVQINSDTTLEDILVYDQSQKLIRLAMTTMHIQGLEAQDSRLKISSVGIDNLRLFQRPQEEGGENSPEQFIAVFPETTITEVNRDDEGLLQVAHIQAKDTTWFLERDINKNSALGRWLKAPQAQDETAPGSSVPTAVRLEQLSLLGNNRLDLLDRSPGRVFWEYLEPFTFTLGTIDSRQQNVAAPFTLTATAGKYATLNMDGTWAPLADKLTITASGRLQSLRLPTFNPYISQYYEYSFKSGNVDADIDLQINQGMLKSNLELFIQKVTYERLKEGKVSRAKKITGMPLDYMVDLLRDKKNNIEVSLVVSGDLSNPSFDFTDALLQASSAAAKEAAISYFAPLGVSMLTGVSLPVGALYVTGKVVKWVTTMRFAPVLFEAKSVALSPEARQQLDTMAELLLDKHGLEIVLCGKATADEGEDTLVSSDQLSDQKKEFMLSLARSRAEAVKDYLVERGVAPSRLIICAAEIDYAAKAEPRVDIAL